MDTRVARVSWYLVSEEGVDTRELLVARVLFGRRRRGSIRGAAGVGGGDGDAVVV